MSCVPTSSPALTSGRVYRSALELLHVDEYDTAWDDDGVVIWGDARIDSDNPQSPVFSPSAGGGAQSGDVGRFEWHNIVVHFRLTAARRAAGALTVSGAGDLPTLLNSLGPTSGTAASDFPSTQFRLELMFEVVTVQIDRLIGAKLSGWVLVPDPDHPVVKLILPRILLRMTQDSAVSTDFDVGLGSFGAETLEDADRGVASLLAMEPPFALTKGKQFGFGIRKAVLDLSDQHTPLDLLAHFGIGDDWQGIYVPEARLFVATQDSAGVAFNVGVREMLIGIQPSFGLWGDLSFDLDFQGDALKVAIRIYDMAGKLYETEAIPSANAEAARADRYQVTVPASSGPEAENFVLFVDVNSGAAPFVMTAVAGEDMPQDDLDTYPDDAFFNDTANHPEDISVTQRIRLFSQEQRVAVRITSRNPAQRRLIVLDVFPNRQFHPEPSPEKPKVPKPALDPRVGKNSHLGQHGRGRRSRAKSGRWRADGRRSGQSADQRRGSHSYRRGQLESPSQRRGRPPALRHANGSPFPSRKAGRAKGQKTTGALSIVGSVDNFVARALEDTSLIIRVDGFASRESGSAQTTYNKALSDRRAEYLKGHSRSARHRRRRASLCTGFGNNAVPPATTPITSGLVPGDRSANDAFEDPNYLPDPYRVAVASLMRADLHNAVLQRNTFA